MTLPRPAGGNTFSSTWGCLSLPYRRYVPAGGPSAEAWRRPVTRKLSFESAVCDSGDAQLTGDLTAGEPAHHLERLYERHGRAVLGHCTRLLRDVASAEDATQEVFLRVRRSVRLPPAQAMRPWLFRV